MDDKEKKSEMGAVEEGKREKGDTGDVEIWKEGNKVCIRVTLSPERRC
jgi:hypothetical protein